MCYKESVTILLPTYNGEQYLVEQIESILNQTYKNIKLLISDDNSSDSTLKILNEMKAKDDRIEVFHQEKNLGVVKQIEFLMKKVESEYFMLADQDDFWLPEKVEKSVEKLKSENADLVYGDLEVVDQNLNQIYPSFGDFMLLTRKINKCIGSYKVNYLYNTVTGCTILAKKELIDLIIPFPTDSKMLIHDYWIGIMAAINGKVAYIPEKYIKYRQHGNNQVGVQKLSHGFKKFEQVRDWFIEVKLGVFGTYVKNNDRFPEELRKLNTEAYQYFEMIKNKKQINFKGWKTFYKLYKEETFIYFIENFLILNIPCLARIAFYIRYYLKKLMHKR